MKGKWFDEETMIIRVTAADVSTCRSEGHDGTKVERILLCGGGKGWRSNIRKVDVIEDYDSSPCKLVMLDVSPTKKNEDAEESRSSFALKWKKFWRSMELKEERKKAHEMSRSASPNKSTTGM